MINRIKAFFEDRHALPETGDTHTVDELHLAAACLLVHAAKADDSFGTEERDRILHIAEDRLELNAEEAKSLLEAAEHKEGNSVQILSFTRSIKDNFSYDERIALTEMLWEVVYADGHLDDHEAQLMRRIGGLIYVSDPDRGAARKRVLERLKAG